MRNSLLKLLGAIVALMLSTTTFAVGMGGINVTSALGQPLKADIELVAISRSEKDSLAARLASPDAYQTAGLEYPYGNDFKFNVETRADGRSYISATSKQPVNDPFVSLLVELTWSAGKLSREYTFLLDPPGYVATQPVKSGIQPVAPEAQPVVPGVGSTGTAVPEGSAVTSSLQPAPVVTVTPEEQAEPAEQAAKPGETEPVETSGKPEEQAVPAGMEAEQEQVPAELAVPPKEWIEVQRGDTMYEIAARYKLADMNLDRMLVALYRANAEKFDGRNMNRIQAGKILQLPTKQEVESVSLSEARREIHAQAADWNAYRQRLASAAPLSNQPQEAQQIATGKISSSIADMAPVAKESAKEVLKLSKGEAPGDQIGGAGGKTMTEQERKNAAQEDAIARDKALKEQQARAAMLEKNMKDMQRLAQLKAETSAMAQPPQPPATAAPKSAVVAATSTMKLAPAPAKPKPKPMPKPVPKPVKPEPSFLDEILDEPLYLGGAAALLALGGVGYWLYRRRKKNIWIEDDDQSLGDVGEITGRMAAPVVPSPDTGDFTGMATSEEASTGSDNVDPISEADLFLNFGRDAQAEEILKDALRSTPNNHQIHLKLLGIYASRKDTGSFSTIARQLENSGDEDAWQQAVAMGRKLDPDNPMYGGGGFKSMEDTGSATVQIPAFEAAPEPENVPKEQPSSALDFDFDASASSAPEEPSPEQDFLDATQRTSIMEADGSLSPQADEMDFDITSSNPSMPEAAAADKPADDGGMEFTLDFPEEKTIDKRAAAAAQDVDLAGINLNFDDEAPAGEPASGGSTSEDKGELWQEVETKLDLAKAYHEMGDASGAREILEEVLREGDTEQRDAAQNLIVLLG